MVDDDSIAREILRLCHARGAGKTICPSEVARSLAGPEAWRGLMADVRRVATGLAREGEIAITKRGVPVEDPEGAGAIRLGLPDQEAGGLPRARRQRSEQ